MYRAYFKDIDMNPYEVDIYTSQTGIDSEIKLAGNPVVVTTNSNGLFSPIKSQSCTVDIVTNDGKWDLYAINPQEVLVHVHTREQNPVTIFKGYATPMQYGQDWTTWDVLSLECVDLISSLKAIPYSTMGGSMKEYRSTDSLINYLISKVTEDDSLYRTLKWYWPKHNFSSPNGYTISSTQETLDGIKWNEANFFDDDDEQTPWTCYEVLEEICKFFNVSLVTYNGSFYFIDYLYAATDAYSTYEFWQYQVYDMDIQSVSFSKDMGLDNIEYSGGTSSITMPELYNYVSVNTNRYDIQEICTNLYDHKEYHISITKEKAFGDGNQVFTWTKVHFFGSDEYTYKYAFKTYCYLNQTKSNWTHYWYSFRDLSSNSSYYDSATYDYLYAVNPTFWLNTPENRWINTMGATFVHYATMDSVTSKPTKLDWSDAIMFQCAHPAMLTPSINTRGFFMNYDMYDGTLEKVALSYNSDYELNFSPKNESSGTITNKSWLVINAKLWYQQNVKSSGNNKEPQPIDTTHFITSMLPFEDLTDIEPYDMYYTGQNSGYTEYAKRNSSSSYFGQGWKLLKMRLRIGDKYWNGSQWTTTNSTFYISFSKRWTDKSNVEWDSARMYDWMDAISNTDYTDKVGSEGYAIPILPSDRVCGDLHIDIFMPRMHPVEFFFASDRGDNIPWYQLSPIVFMKDFSVEYVYTDSTEWYLNEELETDDIKYTNDTKDEYKYETSLTCKMNSWQRNRPISKSYPIIEYVHAQDAGHPYALNVKEYIVTMQDEFNYNANQEQEYNIIDRQLRHYNSPTRIFVCHKTELVPPYCCAELNAGLDLEGIYVVDKQEFDIRNRNVTLDLVEFGDNEKRTN